MDTVYPTHLPPIPAAALWHFLTPNEPQPIEPLKEGSIEEDGFSGYDDFENYGRFSDLMEEFGYTWEDYKATTEDGYILTLFRITGSLETGPFKIDKPPVLVATGDYSDAASWLHEVANDGKNRIPFQM